MLPPEPVTLLTDCLLAAAALWLATRLVAASSSSGSWPQALWAVAFGVGSVAALAATTVHGLGWWLAPLARGFLWQCALLGSALAGTLVVAGAVLATLRRRWARRLALALLAATLVVELLVISRAGLASDAIVAGAGNIVLVLALTLLREAGDREPFRWLLVGLALAAAGLAALGAHGRLHPQFGPGDACRVLLAAALWPIYRAGLLLR